MDMVNRDGMQKTRFLTMAQHFAGRTWVLLAAGLLIAWHCVDMDKMKIKMLNRVVPASMEDIVLFSLDPSHPEPNWEKYLGYFKTASKILPQLGAARGMMGYCYYHMGNLPEAARQYERAVNLNPQFFWWHYNLGIIYAQQGKYAEAESAMKKAFECSPSDSIMYINSAKIYRELNKHADELKYNTEEGLRKGYRSVSQILVMFRFHLPQLITRDYRIQIF